MVDFFECLSPQSDLIKLLSHLNLNFSHFQVVTDDQFSKNLERSAYCRGMKVFIAYEKYFGVIFHYKESIAEVSYYEREIIGYFFAGEVQILEE